MLGKSVKLIIKVSKVFFQKIVTEIYIQQCFQSYIGREQKTFHRGERFLQQRVVPRFKGI